MCQNWKKVFVAVILVLPLIMLAGGNGQAGEKNPCGKNPCAMKNPCAKNPCAAKNPCGMKNPCAANPCAMKPKPIRKTPITDSAKLMQMGEKLWNDTKLGTSGMACATCHSGGKGLKKALFPKYLKMPKVYHLVKGKYIIWHFEILWEGRIFQTLSVRMTGSAGHPRGSEFCVIP